LSPLDNASARVPATIKLPLISQGIQVTSNFPQKQQSGKKQF
jgi:hypothetical protein